MTARRLRYAEAAAELGVEVSWLQRHIKKLPHKKLGRVVYFTDADLERIDALFHHEPTQAATPRAAGSQPSNVTALKPLPARGAVRQDA
jgi:hypothetical protein